MESHETKRARVREKPGKLKIKLPLYFLVSIINVIGFVKVFFFYYQSLKPGIAHHQLVGITTTICFAASIKANLISVQGCKTGDSLS